MMFSMLLKYNRTHAARKSSRLGGATSAQRRYPTCPLSPESHPHKQINQGGTEPDNPQDNSSGSCASISGLTAICRRLGLQPLKRSR